MSDTRPNPNVFYDTGKRQQDAHDRELIPKRLVYAMFGLAAAALTMVSYAVLTDRPLVGVAAPETAVAVHEVTLSGKGDAVRVVTADGRVLMDEDNGAFIGVVRSGLDRARIVHGNVTGNPPVVITEWESGRWSLDDPATGWRMELSSFGTGNTRHFVRLFE